MFYLLWITFILHFFNKHKVSLFSSLFWLDESRKLALFQDLEIKNPGVMLRCFIIIFDCFIFGKIPTGIRRLCSCSVRWFWMVLTIDDDGPLFSISYNKTLFDWNSIVFLLLLPCVLYTLYSYYENVCVCK